MKTEQSANSIHQEALAHVQHKHSKQLRRTETDRLRLEKRRRKLCKLEAEIAVLVQADQAIQKRRQARIIFNPHAKGALDGTYRPEQIIDCLRTHGIDGELSLKTSGKVARQLARDAVKQGIDLVIVASGDGTVEDVAGQLVGSKTTLGIIPIGTMNNLARSLGIPLNLEDACLLLSMGITRQIDIGQIRTSEKPKRIYFMEMAGIGLSAYTMPLSQEAKKGQWVKLLATVSKAFDSKIGTLTITYDDDDAVQVQTQVVTVINSPLFGENMFVGPDAKMDDGLLDVALYSGMSKLDLERHFMAIAAGKRIDDPRITFRHVRRIRVDASETLVANADLDVLAPQQSWEITIVPSALSIIVGNGIGLTLPVESAPIVPPLTGPQPLLVKANGHA